MDNISTKKNEKATANIIMHGKHDPHVGPIPPSQVQDKTGNTTST